MKVFLIPPNGPKIEMERRAALSHLGVSSTTLSRWCKGRNQPTGRWARWRFMKEATLVPAKRSIRPDLIRYVTCDPFGKRGYYASTADLARTYQATNHTVRRWLRDHTPTTDGAYVVEVSVRQKFFYWFDALPYGDLADVVTDLAPATVRRRARAERIPAVVRREWAPKVRK